MRILLLALPFYFVQFLPMPQNFERKDKLSEYGFFVGPMKELTPTENVIAYDLNSSLFSNYAEKVRFVKLPTGTSISYNDSVVFDFPVGTILIKNFLYPYDFRKPERGRRIIETRLVIYESSGWNAYPYIWNEEQTEAFYDPAGETVAVDFIDINGKKIKTPYAIPNKNQCKGCHIRDNALMPIGPTARNLNKNSLRIENRTNQLSKWDELGILSGLPSDHNLIPTMSDYRDPGSGSLEQRARAYLDINCAHCHSRKGPANTSGLFLAIGEKDPTRLGVNKTPVAAGRGAGDLKFDIIAGEPQHSILVFRMKTNDPAIAMPEIGKEQIHSEGVSLIEAWIRSMPTH